jgi:hypothetical protein
MFEKTEIASRVTSSGVICLVGIQEDATEDLVCVGAGAFVGFDSEPVCGGMKVSVVILPVRQLASKDGHDVMVYVVV